jgi:serine/threonine protein kinase
MTTLSSSARVVALRLDRLVEPAQLQELNSLLACSPDPKALVRALLDRGWLTAYQVNHLLQGRAQELVLCPYVLPERLGEGAMGQVLKARHLRLGRIAAVKLIRKERLSSPEALRRFQREVRAAAAREHRHIVRTLDADEVGGTHLLIMEHIEGPPTSANWRRSSGRRCRPARR